MLKENISMKAIFCLYLASFLAVLGLPFFLFNGRKALLFSVTFFVAYALMAEILFRLLYRIKNKKAYRLIPKIPFTKMYVEPHPYLPYVYKKNFICQKLMPVGYPLHKDKNYVFAEMKSNDSRDINGPTGDRNIEIPKPKNLIRVNCLGASTTGNYISYNGQNYSYPMELERILKRVFPEKDIEVNNLGQGGYTSAEILVKFLLSSIDSEPDIVVIYHGYNDLGPSLTTGFQSDYSHSRINLGEAYHLYELASRIPGIPLASWNFIVNRCFFSQNVSSSLLNVITRKDPDIGNDFMGLNTYKRNTEHLINICKANDIKIVLSTFCHYLYKEIRQDREHLRYHEGVKLENGIIRQLALKHNVPLVENDLLIPSDDKYFVDSVHFAPEGMKLIAKNISDAVIGHIRELISNEREA